MAQDRIQINGEWYVKEKRTEIDVNFSEVAEWENEEVYFKFTYFLCNSSKVIYVDIYDKATKETDVADNEGWIYNMYLDGEDAFKDWCSDYPERWYKLFRDFLTIINEEKGWLNAED